jgi:nucleotide-binding universal stress UspA family protein
MGEAVVRPLLAAEPAAAALCEQSAEAEMVVAGSRGRGGLPGLPLGSVSLEVAAQTRGRVVVVRGHQWRPVPGHIPLPVVVGTDGSPESESAVQFAFEEAALHGAYLLAVCALGDVPAVVGAARHIEQDADQLMSRQQ